MQPILFTYDYIVVNTSSGKDSQSLMDVVCTLAKQWGLLNRVVAVHADLSRVEWPGSKELAAEHAAHYGVRFEVVKRERDLLYQIEHERKKFPGPTTRFCTSEHKTAQVRKLFTRLVQEYDRAKGVGVRSWKYPGPRVHILNCLGMRADESTKRERMLPFEVGAKDDSNSYRCVDRWLPLHSRTEPEVWERNHAAGTRVHYAYKLGLPRVSCAFCLAGETEVVTRQGLRRVRELAGSEHALLVPKVGAYGQLHSHGSFVSTEVCAFGVQPLWRVRLRRNRQQKVIYATGEHRWLVVSQKPRPLNEQGHRDGYEQTTTKRLTIALQPGDKLRALKAHPPVKTEPVPFAVAQGFVYGDGTTDNFADRPASLTIYDEEKHRSLLPYFAAHREQRRDGNRFYYGLPRLWREPPEFRESRAFLLSWLAGYFAADGCVSLQRQAVISSAKQANIELVRSIAAVCGVSYGVTRSVSRIGTGTEPTPLFSVTLHTRDLPEWFFLIDSHRHRIGTPGPQGEQERLWVIEAVEPTDRVEEVYCAVVPEVHAFGLADDVMTGNCIYANRPALMLAGQHNPELLAEYVQVEERIGHTFQHGLSLKEIQTALREGEVAGPVADWAM